MLSDIAELNVSDLMAATKRKFMVDRSLSLRPGSGRRCRARHPVTAWVREVVEAELRRRGIG